MGCRGVALAAAGLALSLGFGAAARPVSGLYVAAGAGANWLVGAEGDVVGEDPAALIARSFGLPDAASVRNAAALAQQGAAAANPLVARTEAFRVWREGTCARRSPRAPRHRRPRINIARVQLT